MNLPKVKTYQATTPVLCILMGNTIPPVQFFLKPGLWLNLWLLNFLGIDPSIITKLVKKSTCKLEKMWLDTMVSLI